MKYECILFDLDGTLIDSGEGITKAVEYAVLKFNKSPLDLKTRQSFIGPSLRDMFKMHCNVDDEGAEKMLGLYREYYGKQGLYECIPYGGISNLLKELSEKGCALYTATAKPTDYAVLMLRKWDLEKYFKKIVGASFDKSKTGKKEIIEEVLRYETGKNAIMIGDTYFDIEGAKENKICSIGVTYGYGDEKALFNSKPDFIAKSVSEIRSILFS